MFLVVEDGDAVLPDVSDLEIDVSQLGGSGTDSTWGCGAAGCRVYVSKQGRYRITVPEIRGFKPLAPREVNLPVGTHERVVFELDRK